MTAEVEMTEQTTCVWCGETGVEVAPMFQGAECPMHVACEVEVRAMRKSTTAGEMIAMERRREPKNE